MRKGMNEFIAFVLVVVFVLTAAGLYNSWQTKYVLNVTKSESNSSQVLVKECSKEDVKIYAEYQDSENLTTFDNGLTYVDLDYNGTPSNQTTGIDLYINSTVNYGSFNISSTS